MKINIFVLIGLITLLLTTSVYALPSWLIFDKKVKEEHENTKRQNFPRINIGGERKSESENPDKFLAEL
ncbi:hypothetical protein GLOIN_2v1660532 [Rhizophagus clarus]|uniref:Uncharacterized protein n=1 Tax=Rhizophagus clarus TaxID=94130 RepID=A0A8H3KYI0_9GLOM|nr:hypothetical protein GLOIN_2v1660532 [Rhizophagus clarus]